MWKRVRLVLAIVVAVLLLAGIGFYLYERGAESRARKALDERALEIARHREAQRAQMPAPAPTPAPVTTPPSPSAEAATPPVPAPNPAPAAAPYWTDFRGPRRDGHYTQRPIRTDWGSGPLRPLWKQPVGGGHASFVIANGRAFTIEQRGREEVAAAYDFVTGRELWTNTWSALFRESYGGEGPRATPTWRDGRVYALGAAGELRALDEATGRMLWRANVLDDAGASNLQWGMAASPLVVGNHVIVLPGGSGGKSVAAYDKSTGRRVWSALDDQAAYSSPMHLTIAGKEQLVVLTATRLVGLSLDGGGLLWEFPWRTFNGINTSQPLLIGGDRLFVSSGYDQGAALIQVSSAGETFTVRELWRTNRMKNQFTSSVHHDGFIYGLDESILACLDASSGALKWKGGRYGYGQVMLADGHLIVTTEDGELALVRATPERHVEIARFPVLEGRSWNHPAMADGYLLIRNINEMAAFDLRRD
jgi:outer membrane protein assembly factor BamB